MRAFLSVNVDFNLKQELAAMQEQLQKKIKGVRWVNPELLHITLLFLGEIDQKAVSLLEEPLQKVGEQVTPFEVTFEQLGAFPGPKNPRVFWIGIQHGGELRRLAGEVRRAVLSLSQQCRFKIEDRDNYRPHLTLGRKKRNEQLTFPLEIFEQQWFCKGSLYVDRFFLMHSRLQPQGPIYTPLKKFFLKK